MSKAKITEVLSSRFVGKTNVYLDLEYISEGLKTKKRPTPEQWKEVIQFGAVKFDHSAGKELEIFTCLVKPTVFTPHMAQEEWNTLSDITGLHQKDIMEGEDFQKAFAAFQKFSDGHPVVIMLGDKDVLEYNFSALKLAPPTMDYTRLKPILCEIDAKYEPICSGELYKEVGLTVDDVVPDSEAKTTHNGLFDARSMAWFVQKVIENKK